jgi:large subunit ribosomal protein L21
MYAVVKTGGKQHRVREGDLVRVEKLAGDVGAKVTLEEVLMVGGEGASTKVGTPLLSGATVEAEIVKQGLAKKILVFKMKRRKNYHRRYGHRQPFTHLKITKIAAP